MVTILRSKFRDLQKKRSLFVRKIKEKASEEVVVQPAKKGFASWFTGLQAKILLTYLFLFAVTMVLLNTYPVMVARNLIFESKEIGMKAQTTLICTSISGLEGMTTETIQKVVGDFERDGNILKGILVVDPDGAILYAKEEYTEEEMVDPKVKNFGIGRALSGSDVFYSTFHDGVFSSCTSIPVTVDEKVLGAVHLYEFDREQGKIIQDLQSNFRNFTAAAAFAIIGLSLLFSRTITKRLRSILEAIKYVREGEYSYRVFVGGKDEVAQLGQEFNSLTDRLETTEEVRRRFVSDASHELKTPLASIRLLSDSILQTDTIDAETVKEFVEDIGNEAERLARTTEKLLNLTRLDNKIVFPKQIVDVRQVVKSTLRMLEPIADNYEVTLTSDLGKDCTVFATDDDIYQIIMNLVENAIKYNLPGGNVHILLKREEKDIILTVEDTGIGIPEADLPNIFDRFYRVDKARSRATGGTGLGLSIVKTTVEEHGGTITVSRREHGGTKFEVHFKYCMPEERKE